MFDLNRQDFVHYTVERKEKSVFVQGRIELDFIINRLLDLTGDANAPILMMSTLRSGKSYEYDDKGYNVTVKADTRIAE